MLFYKCFFIIANKEFHTNKLGLNEIFLWSRGNEMLFISCVFQKIAKFDNYGCHLKKYLHQISPPYRYPLINSTETTLSFFLQAFYLLGKSLNLICNKIIIIVIITLTRHLITTYQRLFSCDR